MLKFPCSWRWWHEALSKLFHRQNWEFSYVERKFRNPTSCSLKRGLSTSPGKILSNRGEILDLLQKPFVVHHLIASLIWTIHQMILKHLQNGSSKSNVRASPLGCWACWPQGKTYEDAVRAAVEEQFLQTQAVPVPAHHMNFFNNCWKVSTTKILTIFYHMENFNNCWIVNCRFEAMYRRYRWADESRENWLVQLRWSGEESWRCWVLTMQRRLVPAAATVIPCRAVTASSGVCSRFLRHNRYDSWRRELSRRVPADGGLEWSIEIERTWAVGLGYAKDAAKIR